MYSLRSFIILFFISLAVVMTGQIQPNLPWDLWQNPATKNFKEIQIQVEKYFEGKFHGRGSGYKQWKRWEFDNQSRLDSDGKITNYAALDFFAYEDYVSKHPRSERSPTGDWRSWGPTEFDVMGGWNPGVGRINVIAFHPTDPNTIFAGAPVGGLWKSTNSGTTWTCLTNLMTHVGVSGIAIDPTNANIIYILTGDGDGGGSSIGVYKSTNGGTTWTVTGLSWAVTSSVLGFKLIINPSNANILYAATSNGLWRTANAGVTWTKMIENTFTYYDVEFKPGLPTTVYTSTYWSVYVSTDNGLNWVEKPLGTYSERIQLAVSPNNENAVYAIGGQYYQIIKPGMPPDTSDGFKGLYYSSNSGNTFNLVSNTPNIIGGAVDGNSKINQVPYDLILAVNPLNVSNVIAGGINTWSSVDGGVNWTIRAYWNWDYFVANPGTISYNHADMHALEYNPLNNKLYSGSDGGIYVSTDHGVTWSNLTHNMDVSMIYHFTGTDQDVNFMLAGMQDNGSSIITGRDSMINLGGGDGVDCMINPTNKNELWVSAQLGGLRKTEDGGQTWIDDLRPGGDGPFVTTYEMLLNYPDTMFCGWNKDSIQRTFNGGVTWTKINMVNGGEDQPVISISSSRHHNTIYAATFARVLKSTNFGSTWSTVYTASNFLNAPITSVTVDPWNPAICYITRGGYTADPKVILVNGGSTADGTLNLPAIPANVIAVEDVNGSALVYVGNDMGVYYINMLDPFSGWIFLNEGFPNVIVRDLEIYQTKGIIRAATFGRGIWESGLYSLCALDLALTVANDPSFGFPGFQSYESSNTLTSNRVILGAGGDVTYKAGDLVLLTDGFLAVEGNKFVAGNAACEINLSINGGNFPVAAAAILKVLHAKSSDEKEKTEESNR
ncbi:MAG TPA: hypothetical protein VFG10_08100 [Saprospiraceae bacterium]|nr:hypothetical protein [Saprospiraceae bacterium]